MKSYVLSSVGMKEKKSNIDIAKTYSTVRHRKKRLICTTLCHCCYDSSMLLLAITVNSLLHLINKLCFIIASHVWTKHSYKVDISTSQVSGNLWRILSISASGKNQFLGR